MRFIFGIIVGCLLTIGVAYIHDTSYPPASVDSAAVVADGRMVNWEIVDRNVHGLNGWMHDKWSWLNGQFKREG